MGVFDDSINLTSTCLLTPTNLLHIHTSFAFLLISLGNWKSETWIGAMLATYVPCRIIKLVPSTVMYLTSVCDEGKVSYVSF